jgi:HSP20 family protein
MNDPSSNTTAVANPVQPSQPEPAVYVPAADIYETRDSILIRCDMPGVAESDVEIILENRLLTLSGPQQPVEREGFDAILREYPTGVYRRSFNLNRDLDGAAVKARMSHGVLEIEIPKAKAPEARRIPVGG